jgi:hypothetical protein
VCCLDFWVTHLTYCTVYYFSRMRAAWFLEGFGGGSAKACYDATGNQPNIHPGSITSTGRQRVGPGTATSTQAAQLIGGGISPTLFTSPVSMHINKERYTCMCSFTVN